MWRFTLVLFAFGCASSGLRPEASPAGSELLYRYSVAYTPCPQSGCASDTTSLSALGELVHAHSDAPPTREQLSPAKMAAIRKAIRADAARLFRPMPTEPIQQPNDATGSCEVWLDGKQAGFAMGSPECAELAQWIGD
jgi:hypothetical protein